MTRINSGIHANQLVNAHAFAEFRELTRIPAEILHGETRLERKEIPRSFTLGSGHVRFFYDKQLYLLQRYKMLLKSILERRYQIDDEIVGRNIANFVRIRRNFPQLWNDYEDHQDAPILIERIKSRLYTMKNLKYFQEKIDQDQGIAILESSLHGISSQQLICSKY